jgi:hypothetical protein
VTRCPQDFARALAAIDAHLVAHEPEKQGAWRMQSVEEHLTHLTDHALKAFVPSVHVGPRFALELISTATRALMALERSLAEVR